MSAIAEKDLDKKKETIRAEKKEKITVPAKFQQLERARDYLAQGIAFEEKNPEDLLYNTAIWTLSAKDSLFNILKRLRKKIDDSKKTRENLSKMVSKGETAKISKDTRIAEQGIKEVAEAQLQDTLTELKRIAEEIIKYLDTYSLMTTQYYVHIAGRYAALLTETKRASNRLNEKQKEIDLLQEEYSEYYHAHDRMKLAILGDAIRPGWLKDLRKKIRNAKNIKDYEMFANGVELFILTNKKQMDLLGKHIKLQVEVRFKEAVQLADELLKTASTYA